MALCLACQTLEPEDHGRFQGGHFKQIVFFFFFFFFPLVMQNNIIQEIWNNINDKNYTYYFFLISSKFVGMGITLALLQDNKSGDPIFSFF